MNILNIPTEEIVKLYVVDNMNTYDISERYNCPRKLILEKLGIKTNRRYDIPIDTLIEQYTNEDRTAYELSDIYGLHRKHIIRRLRDAGVQIKRHKRKYSFFYEQKLSETQKQLLYGSLLGDGHLHQHHIGINGCRFIETHGMPQFQYLQWKMKLLDNFISKKEPRMIDRKEYAEQCMLEDELRYDDMTNLNSPLCQFMTVLHKDFQYFRDLFYQDNVKIVRKFKLTPFALAVWYFDDGSINDDTYITIHTQGFDDISIENLLSMLYDDLSIIAKPQERIWKYKGEIKKGNTLYFSRSESEKILSAAKQFCIPCMSYKLPKHYTWSDTTEMLYC